MPISGYLSWVSTIDIQPDGSMRGVKDMADLTAEEVAGEIEVAVSKAIVKAMRGKTSRRIKVQVTAEPIPVYHAVGAEEDSSGDNT